MINLQFTLSHVVTKSDDSALPTWLTFVDSGSSFDFIANSTDSADVGSYTIKITATATLTSDGTTSSLSATIPIVLTIASCS